MLYGKSGRTEQRNKVPDITGISAQGLITEIID
jgi:hypothetical protein